MIEESRMSVVFDPQFQEGLQFLQAGQYARAEFALGHVLMRHPGQVAVLCALAECRYLGRDMRQAQAYVRHAQAVLPADASLDDTLYLSRMLRATGENEAANAMAQRWLSRGLGPQQAAQLANHLLQLDLIEQANAVFARLMPNEMDDGALAASGVAMLYAGDVSNARMRFQQAIARNPGNAEAAIQLAMLGVPEGRDARVAQWQMLCRQPLDVAQRAQLQYACFHEFDAQGKHDAAFTALQEANALRRLRTPYNAAMEDALVDDYLGQLTRFDFPQSPAAQADAPCPVFIVGLPRTGTTLLEKTLSGLADVHAVGEHLIFRKGIETQLGPVFGSPFEIANTGFAGQLDFEALGQRYRARTLAMSGGRRFYTDKEPFNFAYAGLIATALPEARIIHIRRNPMDACFSGYKQSFAAGAYPASYGLDSLASYYRNYARVMAFWREALDERMLEIRYEDLVLRHDETLAHIKSYCRFGDAVAAAAPRPFRASTLSAAQVQKPIHAGNINAWAKYADYLQPLRQALDAEYTAYMAEVEGAEVL